MPNDIMVKTVPNQAFKLPGRKGGYICSTHVFKVTPVLKYHSATPDTDFGITHIAPMNRPIQRLNASEILALHRLYWHGAPKLGSAEAQGEEGSRDGSGGVPDGTGGGVGGIWKAVALEAADCVGREEVTEVDGAVVRGALVGPLQVAWVVAAGREL